MSRRSRIPIKRPAVLTINLLLLAAGGIFGQPSPPIVSGPPSASRSVVLFFGDSITAGYGVEREQAFPALIQQKIDEHAWPFEVVNAGLSGETTSAGLRRMGWVLQRKFDYLILELGANDGLRGVPLTVSKQNLQGIIDKARAAYPKVRIIVAGMKIPPNLGPAYTREFEEIFPVLAKESQSALIPFLLEGVGGMPELNLPDGIHPTVEGHKRIAENVWRVLGPLLEADAAGFR